MQSFFTVTLPSHKAITLSAIATFLIQIYALLMSEDYCLNTTLQDRLVGFDMYQIVYLDVPEDELSPRANEFLDGVVAGGWPSRGDFMNASMTTAFTEDMLGKACEADAAIFFIDATAMSQIYHNSTVDSPHQCNHWVYLRSCDVDQDEYRIWTWGYYMTFTKADLVGIPGSAEMTGLVCRTISITGGPGKS